LKIRNRINKVVGERRPPERGLSVIKKNWLQEKIMTKMRKVGETSKGGRSGLLGN